MPSTNLKSPTAVVEVLETGGVLTIVETTICALVTLAIFMRRHLENIFIGSIVKKYYNLIVIIPNQHDTPYRSKIIIIEVRCIIIIPNRLGVVAHTSYNLFTCFVLRNPK